MTYSEANVSNTLTIEAAQLNALDLDASVTGISLAGTAAISQTGGVPGLTTGYVDNADVSGASGLVTVNVNTGAGSFTTTNQVNASVPTDGN